MSSTHSIELTFSGLAKSPHFGENGIWQEVYRQQPYLPKGSITQCHVRAASDRVLAEGNDSLVPTESRSRRYSREIYSLRAVERARAGRSKNEKIH